MSDTPMKTRRTPRARPAGFTAAPPTPERPAPTPPPTPAPAPSQLAAAPTDKPDGTATQHSQEAVDATSRSRDPYAGAPSPQVNIRLLEPLRLRYMNLVRELSDDGYKTSFTELLTALLDAGPTTPDQAQELIRAYRHKREP